ncbi:MAG: peptide deformylase [Oscillospiraceae bacterium]
MALREIRIEGDPCLRKVCRPVEKFDEKLKELVEDMFETMYEANGVGFAAPQVGILRRIFVVDCGDGGHVFINPQITQCEGEETASEGCLSSPGEFGEVTRPHKVTIEALNEDGEAFRLEAEGLFARALCHENDHLDGKLFKDIATRMLGPDEI